MRRNVHTISNNMTATCTMRLKDLIQVKLLKSSMVVLHTYSVSKQFNSWECEQENKYHISSMYNT